MIENVAARLPHLINLQDVIVGQRRHFRAAKIGRAIARRFIIHDRLVVTLQQVRDFQGRDFPMFSSLALSQRMRRQVVENFVMRVLAKAARNRRDKAHARRIADQSFRINRPDDLDAFRHALVEFIPNLQRQVAIRQQLFRECGDGFVRRFGSKANVVAPAFERKEREFDDHSLFVGIGENGFELRDVRLAQATIREIQRAAFARVHIAAPRIPLPPDAQHVDAVPLKLLHPLHALGRRFVEVWIVDRIEKADARPRERFAVPLKRCAGDRDFIAGLRCCRRSEQQRQHESKCKTYFHSGFL